MKKTILFFLIFVLSMRSSSQEQLVVKPQLAIGVEHIYKTVTTTGSFLGEMDCVQKMKYTVIDTISNGWIIDMQYMDFSVNSPANAEQDSQNALGKMVQKVMGGAAKLIEGLSIRVLTDGNGQIKGIQNMDEVHRFIDKAADKYVKELFAELAPGQSQQQTPQMELALQNAKQKIKESLNEDELMKYANGSGGIFLLNGRFLTNGLEDTFMDTFMDSGLNIDMKRTFTVSGNSVTVSSKPCLTPEEIKQKMMDTLMANVSENKKQLIQQTLNNNLVSFNKQEEHTYEFGSDGWILSIRGTTTSSAMGKPVTSKLTVERVR